VSEKAWVRFLQDDEQISYLTYELEILHQVVSEMNKLRRQLFLNLHYRLE
jgi:hypothetical protein